MLGLVSVLLVSVCVSVVPTIVPDGCVPDMRVPVTAGNVSVVVPATAGAVISTDPDVAPLSDIGIRQYSMCYRKEL